MIDLMNLIKKLLPSKRKLLLYVIAIVAVIICIISYFVSEQNKNDLLISETQQLEEESSQEDELKEYTGEVIVDICGAVKEEKVVTLPADSRIEDAIEAAGGLKEDADIDSINRAQILEDGQKIYIPYEGEEEEKTSDNSAAESGIESDGLVNINEATAEELQTLNGIGPVTAEKIVAWRTEYGRFKTIDDLMEVNGIGEKTYAQIKDKIKV